MAGVFISESPAIFFINMDEVKKQGEVRYVAL